VTRVVNLRIIRLTTTQPTSTMRSSSVSLHVDETSTSVLLGTTYPVLAVAYYSAARSGLDSIMDAMGPDWRATIAIPPWARRRPFAAVVRFVVNTHDEDQREPDTSGPDPSEFVIDERFRLATDRLFNVVFPVGFLLSLVAVAFHVRWALALALVGVAWVTAIVLLYATQTSMIRFALRAADPRYAGRRLTAPRRVFVMFPNQRRTAPTIQEVAFNYLARGMVTAVCLVLAAVVLAVLVEFAAAR
jgi:hypothetical protein